jgi:hypothetical protein
MPTKLTVMLSDFKETTEKPGSDWLKTDISLVLHGRVSPPVPVTM